VALTAPASLHKDPDGVPLVALPAGAAVDTGRAQGRWNEATVEGWIFTPSTARTKREGFDLVVTPDGGENLRRTPNGPVVGRARTGTLLEKVAQQGKWTRVRRNGWIPRKVLPAAPAAAAARPPAPAQTPAQRATARPAEPEHVRTARDIRLGASPDGGTLGMLHAGTPARVVARSGDLVKVQVDGWVPADAIEATSEGALVGVSAAEVRSEPSRFVGQTLEWRLQVIAVKTADELRSEMAPGQPYLLTRGPLPEPGFVYVSIPSAQVAQFQALPPLQELVLRVAIRAARTRFLTTPVAELVSVVSGMEGK
jgi:hypothetical protein